MKTSMLKLTNENYESLLKRKKFSKEKNYTRKKPLCVFITTYYEEFLKNFYEKNKKYADSTYSELLSSLCSEKFGDSDFYSRGLKKAGFYSKDIITNCSILQKKWADHYHKNGDEQEITQNQIKKYKPDVIYIHDMNNTSKHFLINARKNTKLIVGQIATTISSDIYLDGFDIIFSSFPHYLKMFRKHGYTAYYQPLAFDDRIQNKSIPYKDRPIECSFVGGMSNLHVECYQLFEMLAETTPIKFWGYGASGLPLTSKLKEKYQGTAWGKDMFQIFSKSKITINRHRLEAENYANNMRLFEATGCGALLITDYKDNLNDLFRIGEEVVAYRSPEECVALVQYYLQNQDEAKKIALAGQKRTLQDHTYLKRMNHTAEIMKRHLRYREERSQASHCDMSKVSYGYRTISESEITTAMLSGWKDTSIPENQRKLVQNELALMYKGQTIPAFAALSSILNAYMENNNSIIEIGCASGYYYEIIEYLTSKRINYTGIDYSKKSIDLAKNYYPDKEFYVADCSSLPFKNGMFDIAISSCVLLCTQNWKQNIAETVRVSRRYIIAHRTPICRNNDTQIMKKFAYGIETIEIRFNEAEFLKEFIAQRLKLVKIVEYAASPELDHADVTYLFEKIQHQTSN